MANELDFLFTPGYQTSYDDPDGSKHRAASKIEVSGKPGTIQNVLDQLPAITMPPQAQVQPQQPIDPRAKWRQDAEFFSSLMDKPSIETLNPEMGETSKGFNRGVTQLKSDFTAFGGTLAQLTGFDDAAASAYQKAQELADEAAKYPAAVGRVEDAFTSPGAFVNWAAGLLGEQIPIVASIVATGGAGALVGKLVAKGVVSHVAAKQATAQLAQWGLRGVTPAGIGGTAGVIGGTTAIETGAMTAEQLEAGVEVQPGMNLLLGVGAGTLEAASPLVIGRLLGLKLPLATKFSEKIAETMASKGLLARMGTGAAYISATEAGTETLQEVLAIAARSFADENYEVLGEETASRILNAAAGGALIGGLFGGVGGLRKQPDITPKPLPEEQGLLPPPQLALPPPAPLPTEPNISPEQAAKEASMFGVIREGQGLPPAPTILFTETGKESIDSDAITARTAEITEALSVPEARTPMQQALLRQVENQRLADFKRMFEIKTPSPALGKLIALRSTLSEAETQTPAIQAKVEKLSEMIEQQATVEEIEIPKSDKLNEQENARLAYLIEKDRTDGLTKKEIDSLEKLSSKAAGEKKAMRVAATEQNIAELEAEVEAAMKQEGPLYKDDTGSALTGLSPEEFMKIIAPIHNPNVPINVLEHPAQLTESPDIQKFIMKTGRRVHGAYSNGKVHFFSRNMTAANAVRVYLHELAHYGLHNVLPPDVFKTILKLVEQTNKDWVTTYLATRDMDLNNPTNRARGAEEYIAKIAEDGSSMPLLRKIIAILRRWLRSIMPDLRISDDELRMVLAGMSKDLKGRRTNSKLTPSMKVARYVMADDKYNNGYTMRILDRLQKEKREKVTAKYVLQVVKELKMNTAEESIILETLNELGTSEFTFEEFKHALRKRIVPLKIMPTKEYAAYGVSRLNLDVATVEGGATNLYTAPFRTGGSHHFNNPYYVAHARHVIRQIAEGQREDGLTNRNYQKYIIEIQSDRSQRVSDAKPLSPEEKKWKLETMKSDLNFYNRLLMEINDSLYDLDSLGYGKTSLTPVRVAELSDHTDSGFSYVSPPSPETLFADVMKISEDLSLRAADLDVKIQEMESGVREKEDVALERMYPMLFKRILREEVRLAAQQGFKKLHLATVSTMVKVEGWLGDPGSYAAKLYDKEQTLFQIRESIKRAQDFIARNGVYPASSLADKQRVLEDRQQQETALLADIAVLKEIVKLFNDPKASIIDHLDNTYKIIAIRHNDLVKFARQQYTTKDVTDEKGNSWVEIDVPASYAEKDVMAYFSDSAQAARDTGNTLKTDYNLSAQDIEKLSHLWRIKAATFALSPLQLIQRYGVEPLQRYIDRVDNWARTKSEIQSPADDVVGEWMKLPKNDANNLSKVLFEMTIESDEKNRKLTPQEEAVILKKNEISGRGLILYKSITTFFKDIINRLEHGLKYNAARETLGNEAAASKFIADWEATASDSAGRMNLISNLMVDPNVSIHLARRIQNIEKEMERLKNRNYFPYMRFGKYTVTSKDAKGKVVGFWTFASVKEQEEFFKTGSEVQEAKAKGEQVAMSVLTDTQFAFLGMPPEFMETLSAELELSPKQKDELKEIFLRHSPGRAFLRQLIKRKGIAGFSEDAMRVFSTYALNSSNHLARVENYIDMDKALSDFKGLKYEVEERSGDSRGLMTLYNSFQEHRNYIMNPGNELANLRALGFMWYLGFNVKSAMVNMTQVPMVAYPYLASRYGDASSLGELTAAIKTATNIFRGKQGFDTTMDQLVARGIREGFIDESLATELAGISEGSALMRMMPVDNAQRRLNQFSYYGAFLFRNAEKFARIVTFTAAVRLEMKKGSDTETAFQAGKEAIRATMFEYAKWNRPKFMRGKASVFFLFWTFMQNMAYIAGGGQGAQTAMRIWVMMALMAGLQGLPFAENLLDILDWGNEKVRRTLGLKGHYTDLRTEIRELLTSITDSPDMIMHGLARHYGLGPLHLLSLIGVPIPHVDTSGSISMGRIIPGIKELTGSERNPDEKLGRTLVELAGPVFGMPYALWKAVEDNDPDSWKRFERAMPTAMKAASKASRYFARGEEEFRGGGAVAKFSPYDTEQRAEILAQGFGFTPSRITQRYELRAAQQMMKEYFTVRRDMLMDSYAFASQNRDREGLADVRQAIKEYNMSVPHPALKINHKSIMKSLEARKKGAAQREKLTPGQKMYRPAFQDVAKAYPEGSTQE